MAGEISTTEQIVEITTTENAVAVAVTESPVAITVSDIGLQGATGVVDATLPITYNSTTKTIGINDGTTAQKGAVQLEDSVTSTSTTTAATPNSVKTAYDLANTNATAQQVHVYVKNGSGSAMTKGQVVYINSASGANPLIALAQANTEATSSKTLGVLEQDLAVNAFGYVATEGILTGVNTGTASDGDPIWLSGTTAGGMLFGLANKPSAPTHMVFVGYVLRAQSQNGVIYVKPQNGFELEELHNVAISSPTTGQSIVYNSTTSLWNNGAPAPASHASTHASGGSDPVTISPSQLTYPLATAWVSGTTYAVGDVVTYQTGYYVRRVAGAGTNTPNSDTANWAVRSQPASILGSGTAVNFVGYNSTSGITALGMAIGTPPQTIPSTGLTVSNGSITVSSSTNGISVTGSGGVTTGSGGLTASGGVTATGSSVIQNTGTGGISAGSGGLTSTGGINVTGSNSGTLRLDTTSITTTPLAIYTSGTPTASGITISNGNPTSAVNGAGSTFQNMSIGDTLTATGFTTGNGSYTIAQLSGAFTLNTPSGGSFSGTGTLTANRTGTGAPYALSVSNSYATVAGITPNGVFYGSGASLTNLNGANITANSIPISALPAYSGTSSVVVTDGSPTIAFPTLNFPIISSLVYSTQPASTTISSTSTLTSAQIFSGILLSSTTSAWTSTLPSITTASTGMEAYWTSLNNGVAPPVNTCFEISFINTGTTNAWTITIPTGWTGVPVTTWTIAAAPSATIPTSVRARIVKRSTTAYSIFRLS